MARRTTKPETGESQEVVLRPDRPAAIVTSMGPQPDTQSTPQMGSPQPDRHADVPPVARSYKRVQKRMIALGPARIETSEEEEYRNLPHPHANSGKRWFGSGALELVGTAITIAIKFIFGRSSG